MGALFYFGILKLKWMHTMPGAFDWPEQYAGDTAPEQIFKLQMDGAPISLVGATVKMQARKPCGTIVLDLTSATDIGITITDASGGEFCIGGYLNPDVEAALSYDIEVTFPTGRVTTYLKGIYPIYGQVTK